VPGHLVLDGLGAMLLLLFLGPLLVDSETIEVRDETGEWVFDEAFVLREVVSLTVRGSVVAWRKSAAVA
jgi:hypothetical protein